MKELKGSSDIYLIQVQNWTVKYEALERAKNKEIEELHLKTSQQSKISFENEMETFKNRYELEIKRL